MMNQSFFFFKRANNVNVISFFFKEKKKRTFFPFFCLDREQIFPPQNNLTSLSLCFLSIQD